MGNTLEENLAMIHDTVAYLKSHSHEVIGDAEHFFDGYKANPDYALSTLTAAVAGGADCIVLCDYQCRNPDLRNRADDRQGTAGYGRNSPSGKIRCQDRYSYAQ